MALPPISSMRQLVGCRKYYGKLKVGQRRQSGKSLQSASRIYRHQSLKTIASSRYQAAEMHTPRVRPAVMPMMAQRGEDFRTAGCIMLMLALRLPLLSMTPSNVIPGIHLASSRRNAHWRRRVAQSYETARAEYYDANSKLNIIRRWFEKLKQIIGTVRVKAKCQRAAYDSVGG